MTELAALNVRLTGDASDLRATLNSATGEINKVGAAADTAAKRTTGLTGGMSRLGNISGQTRSQIQNVGFQLQDIAVQLQAGTRASVVFAQQGSQILSVFGPMGSILGALAAIGIPALAFAFTTAADEAKTLEDALSDLKDIQEELKSAQDILKMSTEEITSTYGVFADQVRESAKLLAELRLAQVSEALKEPITVVNQALDDLNLVLGMTGQSSRNIGRLLEKNFGIAEDQAIKLRDALQQVADATDVEGRLAALRALDEIMTEAGIETEKLPKALKDAIAEAIVLTNQMAQMSTQASDTAAAISTISYGPPRRGGRRRQSTMLPELVATPVNPLIAQLEAVRNALMTQEEAQIASFQRQQETLQSALEKRLLTQQEYNALMESAQQQHGARLAQIDAYRYGTGLQQAGAFFGDMASAMSSGNDKMMKLAQTFGAAEALVNAWRAYNQTLADPSLPFFAKFAAAASVLASGMRAVSAIKGMSGGGSAGASTAGAATAATAAPSVSRSVAIQLNGGDMFSRDQVVQLINSINEAVEDGAIVRLV